MTDGLHLDSNEIIRLMATAYMRGHQDTVDGNAQPCKEGSGDIALEIIIEEHPKYDVCMQCDGQGWIQDHSDDCYNTGECRNCPVQRECHYCEATGFRLQKNEEEKKQEKELDDDLPF